MAGMDRNGAIHDQKGRYSEKNSGRPSGDMDLPDEPNAPVSDTTGIPPERWDWLPIHVTRPDGTRYATYAKRNGDVIYDDMNRRLGSLTNGRFTSDGQYTVTPMDPVEAADHAIETFGNDGSKRLFRTTTDPTMLDRFVKQREPVIIRQVAANPNLTIRQIRQIKTHATRFDVILRLAANPAACQTTQAERDVFDWAKDPGLTRQQQNDLYESLSRNPNLSGDGVENLWHLSRRPKVRENIATHRHAQDLTLRRIVRRARSRRLLELVAANPNASTETRTMAEFRAHILA